MHAGIHTRSKVNIHYIDSEALETEGAGCDQNMDAILVPGGFWPPWCGRQDQGDPFARENNVPYLGICLGMQLALIEYAAMLPVWATPTAPNSTRKPRIRWWH